MVIILLIFKIFLSIFYFCSILFISNFIIYKMYFNVLYLYSL
nr:MAG TPA: hypothetical protein [Caudoviricetes sp.]